MPALVRPSVVGRGRRAPDRALAIRSAIAEHDPDIVLVDYFDTLVTRVVPKVMIKPIVARHVQDYLGLSGARNGLLTARRDAERRIGQRHRDAGLDPEHRLYEMAIEIWELLGETALEFGSIDAQPFAQAWVEIELAVERLAQRIDHEVVDALRPEADSRRLVVVSDFHLPADRFAEMLSWHGLSDLFDEHFVSCDSRLSKKSGRLYDHVIGRLEGDIGPIDRNRVLMIGDHPVSDYEQAELAGLRSVLIERRPERRTLDRLDRRWPASRLARHRTVRSALAAAGPVPFVELAVTLFAFTERLRGDLAGRNDPVLFLAREGKFLKDLFDLHQRLTPSAAPAPLTTRYLVVSRRSTALAGLAPTVDEEDFHSLLGSYPEITLRALVTSLGFDAELVGRLAVELGADADGPVPIESLKANARFRRCYRTRHRDQTELLHCYVDQLSGRRSGPLTVVDVGWKGTIQDHLQNGLGRRRPVTGHYLGVVASGELPNNERKHAVLFDSRERTDPSYRVLRHFKSLYEFLLQADHGSAARYLREPDGTVVPVLDEQEQEQESFARHIQPVQEGIEAAFAELCRQNALRVEPLLADLDDVARFHRRMLFFPRRTEVELIRSLQHYENFGHMTMVTPGSVLEGPTERLRAIAGVLARPRRIVSSGWPPVTLSEAGLRILIQPVGVYRLVRETALPHGLPRRIVRRFLGRHR